MSAGDLSPAAPGGTLASPAMSTVPVARNPREAA